MSVRDFLGIFCFLLLSKIAAFSIECDVECECELIFINFLSDRKLGFLIVVEENVILVE